MVATSHCHWYWLTQLIYISENMINMINIILLLPLQFKAWSPCLKNMYHVKLMIFIYNDGKQKEKKATLDSVSQQAFNLKFNFKLKNVILKILKLNFLLH